MKICDRATGLGWILKILLKINLFSLKQHLSYGNRFKLLKI